MPPINAESRSKFLFGKIRRHRWKECVKVSKLAKLEGDTS